MSQSIQEIQKLRDEYRKFQNQGNNSMNSIEDIDNDISNAEMIEINNNEIVDLSKQNVDKSEKNYFGFDFFSNRETVSFWENIPVSENYLLGPGDELIISIWGETQLRKKYIVSRDGEIYDDRVGLLPIANKSVSDAQFYLKNQFARVFSTLKGKTPTSFIDLSLGKLRSINVNFVGQLNFPGSYPIHPFSNVINGIIQAGGLKTSASLRAVTIKRDGKVFSTIDLYEYFTKGNLPNKIQLRDQDIIVIPPRISFVEIDSAITNPGIYELKKGETLDDLINFAGNRTFEASNKIEIIRDSDIYKDDSLKRFISYIDLDSTRFFKVRNGDKFKVLHKNLISNFVDIIGQVKAPGRYSFYQGMMLSELLDLSSGLEDSTYNKSVYLESAEIIRKNPNKRYDDVIKINLNDFIGVNPKELILQNMDKIIIHANLNFFERNNIKITGEIMIPGEYPLIQNNETLASIIQRAGGFTDKSFKEGIEIHRNNYRVAWKRFSIPVMSGDSIHINEVPGTVLVTGEVYNPGLIEYNARNNLKDYIGLAGGPTKNGDIRDIIIIRANGEVIPKTRFKSIKINNGSTIIINEKEPRDPFNATEFANNTLSIVSSLVTIMVLSRQLN